MTTIQTRYPAVAGTFYPGDPVALADQVDACLRDGEARLRQLPAIDPEKVRALVVPHAGYVYSGPVAGTGYALLPHLRDRITRVLLLGPAHYVPVRGCAVSGADAFATPLGVMPVDVHTRDALLAAPCAYLDDAAHAPEHSLEVHLPFLQRTLGDVRIVPMVIGVSDPLREAALIEPFLADRQWLVVVSSDLSHYLQYDTARSRDARTALAIVECRWRDIGDRDACGCRPLRGLLRACEQQGLVVRQLDLRNSGDTAGPRDRVVGYGTFVALQGGSS
jgi:MEMO1 family protein